MRQRLLRSLVHSAFVLAPFAGVAGEAPKVYPTPHALKVTGGMVTLSSSATITGADKADSDAVRLLRGRLALCPPAGDIREVVIGERGEPAVKGFDADLPAVSGAYKILVTGGRLVLVGADARGTFYAMQTLRQLLDSDAAPADMPSVEIEDGPDIPFRGIVEGFYGIPGDCWDHEGRLSLLAFCGLHKLDTYIYGPKDDPYHRAHWRLPYPEKEAARIRELVAVAGQNKVDFVWAIHPGLDIRWTESDYRAAKAKFESMYQLGVRSFAVFFDDIGGEGTNPVKQAELLNRLNRDFVKANPDVTPLILCPTEYNKGWANQKKGSYLDILGERLDPSIRVMWTGNGVVSDLDKPSMEYIDARLNRKAYVWWNFPVNDFVRDHLLMGPAYGNTPDATPFMSGFVSNPMGRSEASKVGLYGVAGYTWNAKAYDPQPAWEDAIREVMPKASEAFRIFCSHNGDPGPNGHGYRRAESVAIAPVARAFLDAFRSGKSDKAAFDALRAEFVRIAAAPSAIRAGAENPRLLEEIGPWLDAFEQLGRAGVAALDTTVAGDSGAAWAAYARAAEAEDRMNRIGLKNDRSRAGVKTGSLVLGPLVTEVMRSASARIRSSLTGVPVAVVRPETNSATLDGLDKMLSPDPKAYYYSREVQKVGDWFGVDLGGDIPVTKVHLLMGRQDGDHDIVHKGQLEVSSDGGHWTPLGGPTTGEAVNWAGAPVVARKVRYRVLHAGKLDGTKNDVWCAIREFLVNPAPVPAKVFTAVKNFAAIPARVSGDTVSLAPQLEVTPLAPGRYVGVELPAGTPVSKVEADLSSAAPATWAAVETSPDGSTWKTVRLIATGTSLAGSCPAGERARFVRVRNAGKMSVDVKLAVFKVTTPGAVGEAVTPFTDGDLDTAAPIGAKRVFEVPANARGVALLFSSGAGAGAKIGVASSRDGGATSLGVVSGDLAEYPLPAGVKFVVVVPASPEAGLHEVLWRVK